jgi:hypothetical protein
MRVALFMSDQIYTNAFAGKIKKIRQTGIGFKRLQPR